MTRKTVFIRRGLDSGTFGGRAHGVFNRDLIFDYFPVSFGKDVTEKDFFLCLTYSDLGCRLGGYLSDYLPERLKHAVPYINPNFDNLTFEERLIPLYKNLQSLTKGDLIVFYESLKLFKNHRSFNPFDLKAEALFIIGFFTIDRDVIITEENSSPSSDELLYLKRRFRGHPFLFMNNPVNWHDFIYEEARIFLSGDQVVSGLFEYALEISHSELRENNNQPINEFFRERWGINKSIMRTPLIFAGKPEKVKRDLENWLVNPRKTAKKFVNEGWKPKFKIKVR